MNRVEGEVGEFRPFMMPGLNCKYIDVMLCLSKVKQYILFYSDGDSEFYYVDPGDRDEYISLGEYFNYLKQEGK